MAAEGAYILHRDGLSLPLEAATALIPKTVVRLVGTTNVLVDAAATCNYAPWGQVDASYTAGEIAAVYEAGNVVKVVAAASVGAGAEVGVASNNSAVGPISGASGSVKWSLGYSLTAAGAGETFSVFIRPRQLSGTP